MTTARSLSSWLVLLSLLITVLILWGGIVRLSGSGLSIPEWPLINGSLLPPFSDEGWQTVFDTYKQAYPAMTENLNLGDFERMFAIEYLHRFLAAIVGIFFLAIIVRAKRSPELWPMLKKPLLWAAGLLVLQAVLGGIVVKYDLKAEFVAVHLGTAFVFFSLIFWQAMRLSRFGEIRTSDCRKVRRLGWVALGHVFVQIISGGLVAGTGAGLLLNTWPKIGAYWIPPLKLLWADWYEPRIMNLFQNQVLIQYFHRWWAFAAAIVVTVLITKNISRPTTPRGRIALRAVASLLVLQILLGIGNLVMKVPFWMAFAHLATGLVLFATLLVITHELAYVPDRDVAANEKS